MEFSTCSIDGQIYEEAAKGGVKDLLAVMKFHQIFLMVQLSLRNGFQESLKITKSLDHWPSSLESLEFAIQLLLKKIQTLEVWSCIFNS